MFCVHVGRAFVSCVLVTFFCCGVRAAEPVRAPTPVSAPEPALASVAVPIEEVRIGFFPMHGFHEYDKAGKPIGYDVDYLRRISSNTGWTYRFVRTESWDDALEQLAAGKIDLLGSAQMSPERAERFDYSSYSTGTTHSVIITLSGNDKIQYGAFDSLDQARFGYVRTFIRQDDFARYAQRKGFVTNTVWFDSTEQMRKALHSGEIDAMVCSVMEMGADEKVVAEFAPAPFYYAATKGNAELLEKLDAAIARIKIDSPGFEDRLMDTWYPVSRLPSLSHEEITYGKEHPPLRVAQFINRPPISGTETETESGVISGIVPEILALISRESGLKFVPVPIPAGSAPLELLKSKRADAVAGVVDFPDQTRDPSIRMTEPLLSSRMVLLTRWGAPFTPTLPITAAVPSGFRAATDFIKTTFPHVTIVYFNDTRQCLDAVKQGDADVTIQNAHIIDKYLHGPHYENLVILPTVSAREKLTLALPADADPRLFSILNKSIQRLPQVAVDQIVINNTVAKPYAISLKDFIYQYRRELVAGSILLFMCATLLACWLLQRRKNNELIRENEETLRNITNNINGGVITLIANKGFTIVYANNGFLEIVGYTREQYEEERIQECVTYVHPDDIRLLNEAIASKHRNGDTVGLEIRILHRTGPYVPVMFRGTLAKNKDNVPILFCVVIDITEQRAMIENLKIEKERYQIVVEQSNDIIFEVDLQQQTLLCSPKFKEKFGWQMDSSSINENAPYPLQVHPDDTSTLQDMVQRILLGDNSQIRQLRIRKIDGDYLWCRLLVSCIRHELKLIKLIGKIEDVDEMVRERMRLEEMSRTDALCGLNNKRALRLSVERALKLNEIAGQESALFFIDIDNFKAVNDNLGHPVGDQALRDAAAVLRTLFRTEDIIGRYGGDEFCVFASHIPQSTILLKAGEINNRLRRTYSDASGITVDISASVGVARSPLDGITYDELVLKADRALYTAKSKGKDQYCLFNVNDCTVGGTTRV